MTVYAYPMDRTGCGFYRIIWPLRAMETVGLRCTVVLPGEDAGLSARFTPEGGVESLVIPEDCSAVLLQRPTSERLVSLIPHLRARGVAVLIDVDDDLLSLPPVHPSAQHLSNPASGHSARALLSACQQADLVIASTPRIAQRYAPQGGKVALLRNRLPSHWRSCLQSGSPWVREAHPQTAPRVSAPHTDDNVQIVGWPGSLSTHPGDLAVLDRVLPRLAVDSFTVLGPDQLRDGARPKLGSVPVRFTGSVPFADWFAALRHGLDIGVAPLAPTPFNEAKSWLKPLELAAAGVPCVMSDTPEYRLLHSGSDASGAPGTGLLATDPQHKSFRRLLEQLLGSAALRDELREQGFAAAEFHTLENHLDEWLDAYSPWTDVAAQAPAPVIDELSALA